MRAARKPRFLSFLSPFHLRVGARFVRLDVSVLCKDFPNLFEQVSVIGVYLLSLGCAGHLYSWASYAEISVIS